MEQEFEKIKNEIFDCEKCSLRQERDKNNFYPVVGEGNIHSKIIFVGEAPGLNEAKSGRPFCGASGRVLNELLESIGLKREDVYITNIVKDRPPGNRDPEENELKSCFCYLERQIEIINPEIICSLGRYSMRFLMEKFGLADKLQTISKIHGEVFEIENLSKKMKIIPFFHPAVAIYNANMKETLKNDFKILKKFIA